MSGDAGSLSSTEMDPSPAMRYTPAATDQNRRSAAPSPPEARTGSGRAPRSARPKELPDPLSGISSTKTSRLAWRGGVKRMEVDARAMARIAVDDLMKEASCQTSCYHYS